MTSRLDISSYVKYTCHMGRLHPELTSNVAANRTAARLTQEQLAQAAGVSRQTIVAIEGGTYCPSTILALRLSLLLGVAVNELFTLPEQAISDILERRGKLEQEIKKELPHFEEQRRA